MTYSNNFSFATDDDASVNVSNTTSNVVNLSDDTPRVVKVGTKEPTLADLIEIIQGQIPSIDDIKYLFECGGGVPGTIFVDEYDILLKNPDKDQFPKCKGLNVALPGGWDYQDYQINDPYTGKESGAVVKPILVPIGPPKGLNNEINNPGRNRRQPPQTHSYITSEPHRFMWIHPWLETGASENDEVDGDTPISIFNSNDKWQSGKISNGPADEEVYYGSSFETAPGGKGIDFEEVHTDPKDWEDASRPARIRFKTAKDKKKWIFSLGCSDSVGLTGGDQWTEGLEYQAVGCSGWVNSGYNTGRKTKTNAGIQFLYMMGKMDTNTTEIKDGITALEGIINGGGDAYCLPDEEEFSLSGGDYPTEAEFDLEEDNLEARKKIRDRILARVKKLQARLESWGSQRGGFDPERLYKRGIIDKWKNQKFTNTAGTRQAIEVACEFMSQSLQVNDGKKDDDIEYHISASDIIDRLQHRDITHLEFWNYVITRSHVKSEVVARSMGFDFDLEALGKYKAGEIEFDEVATQYMVLKMTEEKDVHAVHFTNDGPVVELTSGFGITFDEWSRGMEGWCDACTKSGGQFKSINRYKTKCMLYTQDVDTGESYEEVLDIMDPELGYFSLGPEPYANVPDRNDIMEAYPPYGERNAGHNMTDEINHNRTRTVPVKDPKWKPKPGQTEKDRPRIPMELAMWRGGYCMMASADKSSLSGIPLQQYATAIDTGDPAKPYNSGMNTMQVYGPFSDLELNQFYEFVVPQGGESETPYRKDYSLQWHFTDKPRSTQGKDWGNDSKTIIVANPPNSGIGTAGGGTDTGDDRIDSYTTRKPPKKYFCVKFCSWSNKKNRIEGTDGVVRKSGPKMIEEFRPPNTYWGFDKNRPSILDGNYPDGVFFDYMVRPHDDTVKDNPYDEYEPNIKGPVYFSEGYDHKPDLGNEYWVRPFNAIGREKITIGMLYKIKSLEAHETNIGTLRDVTTPEMRLLWASRDADFQEEDDPNWADNYDFGTFLPRGTTRVVTANTDRLLFAGWDSDERGIENEEWSPEGEPWVKITPVPDNDRLSKKGPGYWVDGPRPFDEYLFNPHYQTPLNHWTTYEYRQDPENTEVVKNHRYIISATPGGGNSQTGTDWPATEYEYDVLFAIDQHSMDKYEHPDVNDREDNFYNVFRLKKNDFTGLEFTAPSDLMLFGAHKTQRNMKSWNVRGEEVQIRMRLVDKDVDQLEGPGYWAFTTNQNRNDRYGNEGKIDFHDWYWANPIRHYNDHRDDIGVHVQRGKEYLIRLRQGVDQPYDYRLIYSKTERGLNPLQDRLNYRNYEYTDIILKRGSDEYISFTAQSDMIHFGAFYEDNPGVIPDKSDWSIKGMPVQVEIIEDVITESGPAYWCQDADTMPNWGRYVKPLHDHSQFPGSEDGPPGVTRLIPNRRYMIRKTEDTPNGLSYRLLFIMNNDAGRKPGPSEVVDARVSPDGDPIFENDGLGDTIDDWTYFTAQSNLLLFGAFGSNKGDESEWSRDGEEPHLFIQNSDEYNNMIEGNQYWTDTEGSNEVSAQNLNNRYWTTGQKNKLDPIGPDFFIKGKNYRVRIPDIDPNKNILHYLFMGPRPQALDPTAPNDFIPLERGMMRGGDWLEFKMVDDVLIMGAYNTGVQMNEWNPDGEPVLIEAELMPDDPERGPTYWADRLDAGSPTRSATERAYFPGFGSEAHWEEHNQVGSNYDYHETPRLGNKYRIYPDNPPLLPGSNNERYEKFPNDEDTPYDLRMWFTDQAGLSRMHGDAGPDTTWDHWKGGRMIPYDARYIDFDMTDMYMLFGAFNLRQGKAFPREELPDWSPFGERSNISFEQLPPLPKGPVYFTKKSDKFPEIADPHFYKGINTVPVVGGKSYSVQRPASFVNGNRSLTIWYVKDFDTEDYDHPSITNNLTRKSTPIQVDPLHVEDLLMPNGTLPAAVQAHFYLRGDVIEPGGTSSDVITIKVPDGYNRLFYGSAGSGRTLESWGRDGEESPLILEERPDFIGRLGPTYWGDNGKTEFDNEYFDGPLNYILLDPNTPYDVFKINPNSLDDFNIEIYSFNHVKNGYQALFPNQNSPSDFTYIGTMTKLQESIRINVPGDSAIILRAFNIQNDELKNLTDWSPKGEAIPIRLQKIDAIKGPMYWSDDRNDPATSGLAANAKGKPKIDNGYWLSDPIEHITINKDQDYDLKITKKTDVKVTVWMTNNKNALRPGHNAGPWDSDWFEGPTIDKNTAVGQKFRFTSKGKYVIFGTHNYNKSLAEFSPFGEPYPCDFLPVRWGEGPGYPGDTRLATGWAPDWKHERWEFPKPAPMTPKGKSKFTTGVNYEFKRRNSGPDVDTTVNNYQMWWSWSKGDPHGINTINGRNITKATGRKFETHAQGQWLYFAITPAKVTGTNNKWQPIEWSPFGSYVPWKAKRGSTDIPMPKWLKALLALLAALAVIWALFMLFAPLNVLLEMNEEYDGNQYPIRRWLTKKNDDGEDIGYDYPNNKEIESTDWYEGLDNRPYYFNYTADILARATAKFLRFRHNGYLVHATSGEIEAEDDNNYNKTHFMEFFNMTATYGAGYGRIRHKGIKRFLRDYYPWDKNRNISRPGGEGKFSPVGAVQLDTRRDEVTEQSLWDNADMWFNPTLAYAYLTETNQKVRTIANTETQLAGGYYRKDCSRTSYIYTRYNDIMDNSRYTWNIFNDAGAGFLITAGFAKDKENHNFMFEVYNGDIEPGWAGAGDLFSYYTGVEFDLLYTGLDNDDSTSADWQLNRMNLIFGEYDDYDKGYKELGRVEDVELHAAPDETYTLRQSEATGTPGTHNMAQVSKSNRKRHVKLWAKEPIANTFSFVSMYFTVWIGSASSKERGRLIKIANLRPMTSEDNPFD